MGEVFRNKKILGLSLFQNWVVGPILMFVLAIIFMHNYPEYMAGVIMIGPGPLYRHGHCCNELAKGDTEFSGSSCASSQVNQKWQRSLINI